MNILTKLSYNPRLYEITKICTLQDCLFPLDNCLNVTISKDQKEAAQMINVMNPYNYFLLPP